MSSESSANNLNAWIVKPELKLLTASSQYAEPLFKLICSNREHLSPWMPWLPFVKQQDDTVSFLKDAQLKNEKAQAFIMLMAYKEQIVGVVSLEEFNSNNLSAVLGYWIDYSVQGKGIVTQAARAVIKRGFSELSLNKIVVRCATHNEKSRRVIERLGFTQEGILRQNERVSDKYYDHFTYSLLRSEWKD